MQLCEWEGPRTPLFSSRWEGEWRKHERRMDTGRVCVTRWWVQLLLGGLRDAPRSACTRNDSCAVDPAAALSPVTARKHAWVFAGGDWNQVYSLPCHCRAHTCTVS